MHEYSESQIAEFDADAKAFEWLFGRDFGDLGNLKSMKRYLVPTPEGPVLLGVSVGYLFAVLAALDPGKSPLRSHPPAKERFRRILKMIETSAFYREYFPETLVNSIHALMFVDRWIREPG
jgi:hypothetical protein